MHAPLPDIVPTLITHRGQSANDRADFPKTGPSLIAQNDPPAIMPLQA
jgi:hypothetical protein